MLAPQQDCHFFQEFEKLGSSASGLGWCFTNSVDIPTIGILSAQQLPKTIKLMPPQRGGKAAAKMGEKFVLIAGRLHRNLESQCLLSAQYYFIEAEKIPSLGYTKSEHGVRFPPYSVVEFKQLGSVL